jgi:adenylate cyclase
MRLYMLGDPEGALAEINRALELSPNLASAHGSLGDTLVWSGQPNDGLEALRRYLRLDPGSPLAAVGLLQMVAGYYFCREYESAVETARRVIRSYPHYPNAYRWLATALGQLGRVDEAKAALAKAIAIGPGAFEIYLRHRVPWHRPEDHAHMLEGLRKAGWEA